MRCAAADNIPLSTANGAHRGYLAAHVFWGTPYDEYFTGVWSIMRAAGGRPHWGKMHSLTARELRDLYPRFNDFVKLRQQMDPQGRFLSPYCRELMLG